MAAYAIDHDSPAGPALNGVHDDSSAEQSPVSSRISSDSPTAAPSLTFHFGVPSTLAKVVVDDSSSSSHHFQEIAAKIEDRDESIDPSDVTMGDDDTEELDIKPDLASLDLASPTRQSPTRQSPIVAGRRPRGRPRKHPKPEQIVLIKKPMGRSKTGCITCRRRKKKCDERKPTCVHCEKNNVQCEGYHPKDIWQSGRQKALARTQRRWSQDGPSPLPSIVPGVDDELDWHLFEHFYYVLSNLLSVHPEVHNPFRHQLLPMAQSHRGLMHSLLSLSGTHLLVKKDMSNKDGRIEARSAMHFDKALNLLSSDENMNKRIDGDSGARIPAPTVAQVVVLCLQTICEGNTTGEYTSHLTALKNMLDEEIDTTEEEYLRFLSEFLIYHDISAALTSKRPALITNNDFRLPPFIVDGEGTKNFLRVCEGLVGPTSKTRLLRDRVRKRREGQQRPYVDFNTIMDGKAIDKDLKTAICNYDIGSDEWVAWNLYKTTFWLYLHRTVNNSIASPELESGVDKAIEYMQSIDPNSSLQSVLLTPVFIVACATFNKEQRPAINEAFDVLERFSSLGNIKHARQVVDRVWILMDAGNDRSWDWEGIMEEMNMNFLVT